MTSRRLKPIARIIEERRSMERVVPLPVVITEEDDGGAVASYPNDGAPRAERRFSTLDALLAHHDLGPDDVEELKPIVVFPLRVVVLDGADPEGQCALDAQIKNAGFHSQLVHTCDDALRAMERAAPAVVIIEVASDEGERLLHTFARMPQAPPVIVVSSDARASEMANAYGVEQIDKPCDPRHLLRAMERAIRSEKRPRATS